MLQKSKLQNNFSFFTASAGTLKMLLSFAVGGLLGDVFLHLLPEAWAHNVVIKGKKNNRTKNLF